jgi:hypothetical protein
VIKFVCDLQQVGRWFSPGAPVSFINKTDRHNIAEILLKVALNNLKKRALMITHEIASLGLVAFVKKST